MNNLKFRSSNDVPPEEDRRSRRVCCSMQKILHVQKVMLVVISSKI
jgi:hypothetical protein